jgi:hypothetical protein
MKKERKNGRERERERVKGKTIEFFLRNKTNNR